MESIFQSVYEALPVKLYIDYGGTRFKYCFDDEAVILLESTAIDLVDFIDRQMATYPHIEGIGISFAGQVRDGVLLGAPNIALHELPIVEYVTRKYNIDVVVENDLNAAALYECQIHKVESLATLYIGTGFGSGLIINGSLVRGRDALGGEIGHIPFRKTTKRCGCGRDDCLELSVSGKALNGLPLDRVDAITKQHFLEGLRHAFFTLLNLLDCDLYLFGGSVIQNNRSLIEYLEAECKNASFAHLRKKPTLQISDTPYGNLNGIKILLNTIIATKTKETTNGKI